VVATLSRYLRDEPLDERITHAARPLGWTLLLCIDGQGLVNTGDQRLDASPGDIFLFGPAALYDYHRALGAEEWQFLWINFQAPADWARWLAWGSIGQQSFMLGLADATEWPLLLQLGRQVVTEANRNGLVQQELALNLIQQLLIRCPGLHKLQARSSGSLRIPRCCHRDGPGPLAQ